MYYIKIYLWAYAEKKDEINLVLKHKLLNMLAKKKKKSVVSLKLYWENILTENSISN